MTPGAEPDRERIQAAVLDALGGIAPEVDPASVQPADRLRERFDLDSMDFLNFVAALGRSLGVDIPERDYGKIATLETCVEYLAARHADRRHGQ